MAGEITAGAVANSPGVAVLVREFILQAIAFAVDEDDFAVMHEAVEDGAGDGAVVIEDHGPILEDAVGGKDDGAAFIALADDLKEQIGALFIDREVAQFIEDQESGSLVFFEFEEEAMSALGGSQGIDDFDGGGEAHGMALETGEVPQGDGQMGFAEADPAAEDDIDVLVDEIEAGGMLDLLSVDFLGMTPVKLFEGFKIGETGVFEALFDLPLRSFLGFLGDEFGEELEVGKLFLRRLLGGGLIMLAQIGEVEEFELLVEGGGAGVHGVSLGTVLGFVSGVGLGV